MPVLDHPSLLACESSIVHRIDPRLRILAGAAFSVLVAVVDGRDTLGLALVLAVTAALAGRLRFTVAVSRLASLNGFMLLLMLVLPWSVPGEPLARLGPLSYSHDGLSAALAVAVKGNAIVLMLMVLLATIEVTTLGHALEHLYVPEKLIQILLFTVRYLEILHRQHEQLVTAMRVRGFRPRADLHTYRAYGHLVGMLLVRSLDRSERVLAAMRCRAFQGRFYLLDHFAFSRVDPPFALLSALMLAALAVVEWT